MAEMTRTLRSEYGRPPLTVLATVPTFALRYMLGRVHCYTPDDEVVEMTRRGIERSGDTYSEREVEDTIKAALWIHAENRALYQSVTGGLSI